MKETTIGIANADGDLEEAISLMDTFYEKNKRKKTINWIMIDHKSNHYGYYHYYHDNIDCLYVNPKRVWEDSYWTNTSYGFTDDYSLLGIILHEFAHHIDKEMDLCKDYTEWSKKNGGLFLNTSYKTHHKDRWREETAEVLRLYLSNPYLLKTIDLKRYKWFKQRLKSPTPCSPQRFVKQWKSWPVETRKSCWKMWGIRVIKNTVSLRKGK